jgi:hypothetical protein
MLQSFQKTINLYPQVLVHYVTLYCASDQICFLWIVEQTYIFIYYFTIRVFLMTHGQFLTAMTIWLFHGNVNKS